MKDINGITLKPGDYVKTIGRQMNSVDISNVAIVDEIEEFSATILCDNHGMPMPFTSNPKTLMKLQLKEVSEDKQELLSSSKLSFDQMSLELMSV